MKIAVTAENPSSESTVDARFGRAKYFMILDTDCNKWKCVNNSQNLHAAQGAGIQAASHIVNEGCSVLISGHCGPKAFTALSKAEVSVYSAAGATVKEAADMYLQNKLTKLVNADTEGHW